MLILNLKKQILNFLESLNYGSNYRILKFKLFVYCKIIIIKGEGFFLIIFG